MISMIANRYPKSSVFYMMSIMLCASRAATSFTVVIAFLTIVFRALQIIGVATHKNIIAYIGYGVCALF